MNHRKWIVPTLVLGAWASWVAYEVVRNSRIVAEQSRITNRMQNRADELLTEIVKEQEKAFGIKYDGLPKIVASWDSRSGWHPAGYNFEEDKIILDAKVLYLMGNWEPKLPISLHHELTHYFCDTLYEIMFNTNVDTRKNPGLLITVEGISMYVEWYFFPEKNKAHGVEDCPGTKFTKGDPTHHRIYCNGLSIAQSILDKMGFQNGIAYMLRNPPEATKDFAVNVEEYVQKALAK